MGVGASCARCGPGLSRAFPGRPRGAARHGLVCRKRQTRPAFSVRVAMGRVTGWRAAALHTRAHASLGLARRPHRALQSLHCQLQLRALRQQLRQSTLSVMEGSATCRRPVRICACPSAFIPPPACSAQHCSLDKFWRNVRSEKAGRRGGIAVSAALGIAPTAVFGCMFGCNARRQRPRCQSKPDVCPMWVC